MRIPFLLSVLLLLPTTGLASDAEPEPAAEEYVAVDQGLRLENDPYRHKLNPTYTKGRIAGFRDLYVEPDAWLDGLKPAAAPTEPSPRAMPSLPSGAIPAVHVSPDAEKLAAAGLDAAAVESALRAWNETGDKLVVNAESGVLKVPASTAEGKPDEAALEALRALELKPKKGKAVRLADVATLGIAPLAANAVEGSAGDAPKPAPATAKGDLHIRNLSSSYVMVEINGTQVGKAGPLADLVLHDVPSGLYDVKLEAQNGYVMRRRIATE